MVDGLVEPLLGRKHLHARLDLFAGSFNWEPGLKFLCVIPDVIRAYRAAPSRPPPSPRGFRAQTARCRANTAQISKSRSNSGLGFQVKALTFFFQVKALITF